MNQIDIGILIDPLKLVETRALITAQSGGGKSWLMRKLLEMISGKVHQLVFDYEGEFVTLREKYPFALVAVEGGDIPLSVRYAGKLAETIMETNLSVIIDLYDLEPDDRILFVHEFIHALMNLRRDLYHPTLIYLDEIDALCPQVGQTAASKDIRSLAARGRKRGLGMIPATQRLSKVHKDVAAECQNKFIGQTTLGIDVARAAEELGLSSKEQGKFRELEPGQFLAYGPAISRQVQLFKVNPVETTHVKAGTMVSPPPTPDAIRAIVQQLKEVQQDVDEDVPAETAGKADITASRELVDNAVHEAKEVLHTHYRKILDEKRNEISLLSDRINRALAALRGENEPTVIQEHQNAGLIVPVEVKTKAEMAPKAGQAVVGGAMRMLKAAATFHPDPITKGRMALWARMSPNSGSFSTYLSALRKDGYLEPLDGGYVCTSLGMKKVAGIEQLPIGGALVNLWCEIIGNESGASRMLKFLSNVFPEIVARDVLGERVGMSSTSGSFTTYVSTLKRNGLVEVRGKYLWLSENFADNR